MLRGKRCAALEEVSIAISLQRSFSSQAILEYLSRQQTIERGFAGEQPGLAPVLVVRGKAQQPHSCGATDQRADAGSSKACCSG